MSPVSYTHLHIIAIANQNGGVGNTTTAAHLGIGLAREGRNVVLVDCDPQGSLTVSLGYSQPDELDMTLTDLLAGVLMDLSLIHIYRPRCYVRMTRPYSRTGAILSAWASTEKKNSGYKAYEWFQSRSAT